MGAPLRILLFTGKGGVGKTTVAAATAARAARLGHRTLVLSTDPAHSLADSFDLDLGTEPTAVAAHLWAEQIDSQARLEANWRAIQDYVVSLLNWGGTDVVEAEELSVIPGLDELFSLIDINRYHEQGRYDLLVVDCAPTAETLRLLSLPDALSWYIDRIFPSSRRIATVARPLLGRFGNLPPIASDAVFSAVERLYRNLERVRALLAEPESSSVRLVVNPEKMVVAEARRTYTYLSLFGYQVDAVVVNRLLPDDVTDPYFGKWKEIQADHFRAITKSISPCCARAKSCTSRSAATSATCSCRRRCTRWRWCPPPCGMAPWWSTSPAPSQARPRAASVPETGRRQATVEQAERRRRWH